ncbi:MAG TPA: gluconate 2-dehydrogenase subunit 3 family protein, partial [Pseudonocardia sp.]
MQGSALWLQSSPHPAFTEEAGKIMQLPYASTDAPADEDAPTSPTAAGGSHPLSGGAQTLAAVVDRLIPADEHGPGAVTAGVLDFFERQLRGQLAPLTGLYAEGLAGLDELARAEQGAPFAELSPDHQDALLEHVERLDPVGEHARLRSFFEAVLNHTIDGFLADPLYGGNRDFI